MPYDGPRFVGFLAVPEGFEPFGTVGRPAQSMKDRDAGFSVMHLHDPAVPLHELRLGRGVTRPVAWSALCGRRFTGRWREHVGGRDAQQYSPKHCDRCLRLAAEREHVATYRTRRTGVGNRYGRGNSGGGGRNTHVSCSCGWENSANVTKREQIANYREHLRGVVEEGLWRVEEERYQPLVEDSAAGVAYRLGVEAERIEALSVGGRFDVGRSPRMNDAKAAIRLALPLRRMEER